ncbi:hypothetical protein GGH92_010531, partial [Coemansia sp. RSA 2673]
QEGRAAQAGFGPCCLSAHPARSNPPSSSHLARLLGGRPNAASQAYSDAEVYATCGLGNSEHKPRHNARLADRAAVFRSAWCGMRKPVSRAVVNQNNGAPASHSLWPAASALWSPAN